MRYTGVVGLDALSRDGWMDALRKGGWMDALC